MKKVLLFCILLASGACQDDASEAILDEQSYCVSRDVVDSLSRVRGRVNRLENMYMIRTSQHTYYACNLPEAYKKDAHSIRFDAEVYRVPANVRLLGTPILITRIY